MRIVLTVALVVLYSLNFGNRDVPVIAGAVLILVSYLMLLWAPNEWLTQRKLVFLSGWILGMSIIAHYAYGAPSQHLLWPLVYILAASLNENRRLTNVLAVLAILTALVTNYAYPLPFGLLLSLAAVFVGIRIRWLRQLSYERNQRHLSELNRAHQALQEATVDSMRYAAMEERTRLAREIHDGLGHQLTSMIVQLQALQILLADAPGNVTRKVDQLLGISRRLIGEVRTAVKEWSEDETGLGLVALKGLVSQAQGRSSIPIYFLQESEVSEWPLDTSSALYRILQESITNALRHSEAKSVTIRIRETGDWVVLTVSDDGTLTEGEEVTPGFGLTGIRERCRLLGGTFRFAVRRPHGFEMEAAIPLSPAREESEIGGVSHAKP
ncbi:sensor histidine kinase [Paenibacillus humicola]|uniref:sensor histidine kinase n=1 Tax=Paenibacillus humicola TaxID=3110540 RepID=UPI00237A7BDD|nr:sensor histidine kinase [Paenibacillus humicola]